MIRYPTEGTAAELIVPIVHLNGSGRDRLIENLCDVADAVRAAMDKLRPIGPNGRDYYPEPGLLTKAIEQHERRGLALKSVLESLEAEALEISERYPERI